MKNMPSFRCPAKFSTIKRNHNKQPEGKSTQKRNDWFGKVNQQTNKPCSDCRILSSATMSAMQYVHLLCRTICEWIWLVRLFCVLFLSLFLLTVPSHPLNTFYVCTLLYKRRRKYRFTIQLPILLCTHILLSVWNWHQR